jgi:hypothetical protein
MSETHVTLYGDAASEFDELAERLEEELGIETNAGVVRYLLKQA